MWQKYLKQVKQLQVLQIPRCVSPCNTEGELHTFTDASETAYAAAVYWRTVNEDGSCHVNLIAAKVRVAPLKPVSIPRLELQAALLGCRLAKSVEQETDLKVKTRTFWTDSSIVLSWIKTDPRTFKTFVAHRLAEIEDLTTPQEWRWVPTAENTADDATRDVPCNFDQQHRWFKGPDFLSRDKSCWPIMKTFNKMASEEEKTVQVTTAIMSSESSPDPHRFSCWKRLWRTTARMLQFIKVCKEKRGNSNSHKNECGSKSKYKPLTADLLEKAEILLLQNSQQECFEEEIRDITQGKPVKCNSKLRKLDVVMENGILRLKGRIDAIDGVTRNYKQPIVLDSKNRIARLIIEYCHCRFNHANHATVINELRQRFWLLGLRSAIRAVSRECQWCRVKRAKPEELPTGNLPAERLTHGTFPFTCTGVDYFGPLSVTVVRRHEKRWVALFTCLTTRAVHVELVPSLSTDSMIMALRRFAARRGMPKIIYSDNGTNFVCASKELRDAYKRMSKENMAVEAEKIGIQWKNIPPGAPHMGGAWERLVRSIKNALVVTLKERHPREEVLHTLLLEAEHIVNSRPLTHLSEDLEEEAITPNHFLIGRSCGSYRIGSYEDSELVGRDTWKKAQRLADHFWQRWLREYLPMLLPRKVNRQASKHNLQIGDIVLIVDNSLPRCTWPRGRITQVYPGPDGRTRIVDVETKGGVLRRPSSRIIILVPTSSP